MPNFDKNNPSLTEKLCIPLVNIHIRLLMLVNGVETSTLSENNRDTGPVKTAKTRKATLKMIQTIAKARIRNTGWWLGMIDRRLDPVVCNATAN